VESSCELGNGPSGSIKCWETTEWLHNLWPPEWYSAPQSYLVIIIIIGPTTRVGPWLPLSFVTSYIVGKTLWIDDQPDERPLPTHKTRQSHTDINVWNLIRTHDRVFGQGKTVHA
jgi:hypothetical protein